MRQLLLQLILNLRNRNLGPLTESWLLWRLPKKASEAKVIFKKIISPKAKNSTIDELISGKHKIHARYPKELVQWIEDFMVSQEIFRKRSSGDSHHHFSCHYYESLLLAYQEQGQVTDISLQELEKRLKGIAFPISVEFYRMLQTWFKIKLEKSLMTNSPDGKDYSVVYNTFREVKMAFETIADIVSVLANYNYYRYEEGELPKQFKGVEFAYDTLKEYHQRLLALQTREPISWEKQLWPYQQLDQIQVIELYLENFHFWVSIWKEYDLSTIQKRGLEDIDIKPLAKDDLIQKFSVYKNKIEDVEQVNLTFQFINQLHLDHKKNPNKERVEEWLLAYSKLIADNPVFSRYSHVTDRGYVEYLCHRVELSPPNERIQVISSTIKELVKLKGKHNLHELNPELRAIIDVELGYLNSILNPTESVSYLEKARTILNGVPENTPNKSSVRKMRFILLRTKIQLSLAAKTDNPEEWEYLGNIADKNRKFTTNHVQEVISKVSPTLPKINEKTLKLVRAYSNTLLSSETRKTRYKKILLEVQQEKPPGYVWLSRIIQEELIG
ncbi:MAG: hypothetical protein AAGI38_15555 [Bacteroidota bacterium]